VQPSPPGVRPRNVELPPSRLSADSVQPSLAAVEPTIRIPPLLSETAAEGVAPVLPTSCVGSLKAGSTGVAAASPIGPELTMLHTATSPAANAAAHTTRHRDRARGRVSTSSVILLLLALPLSAATRSVRGKYTFHRLQQFQIIRASPPDNSLLIQRLLRVHATVESMRTPPRFRVNDAVNASLARLCTCSSVRCRRRPPAGLA
jgi:hypothetical protein